MIYVFAVFGIIPLSPFAADESLLRVIARDLRKISLGDYPERAEGFEMTTLLLCGLSSWASYSDFTLRLCRSRSLCGE